MRPTTRVATLPGMTTETERSIEDLAADWLASERESANDPTRAIEPARAASSAYDEAISAASPEDLLLAWQAAQKAQANCEMGSKAWLEARSVSELLRMEYAAATATVTIQPPTDAGSDASV
jgi:hypothetical protein